MAVGTSLEADRFELPLCKFGDFTRDDRCWREVDSSSKTLDTRETPESPSSGDASLVLAVIVRSVRQERRNLEYAY
jgi:hypothetical protein